MDRQPDSDSFLLENVAELSGVEVEVREISVQKGDRTAGEREYVRLGRQVSLGQRRRLAGDR
ncbi:MAG: hypothetical protein E6614_00410, partial [Bradyrhizobium sp.]|nr:hypothetical protein [Bradyrhizobium sp.]